MEVSRIAERARLFLSQRLCITTMKSKKKKKASKKAKKVKEQNVDYEPIRRNESIVPIDPLQRYIAEARKFPPLTPEEEYELAVKYKETGDKEAAFRLITANLILVISISLRFKRVFQNVLDLIQEGNIGLLKAIHKYDPDFGVRFPTYATWWVRAYILKFMLDNIRLVRVGTTNVRRKLIHNLREEKKKLEDRGFTAGPKLLAERFGATEQDVIDVQQSLESRDVSIDAPITEDSQAPRSDFMATEEESVEEEVAKKELQEIIESKIKVFEKNLNEKELMILRERILNEEPVTLQEIGDRFDITREAVRQSEERLKKKLEEFFKSEFGEEGPAFFKRKSRGVEDHSAKENPQ
jgi:RNA polymerase sigma-32 factor